LKPLQILLVVVVLLVGAGAALYFWGQSHPPTLPPSQIQASPSVPPSTAQGPRYPVEGAPAEKPLPKLNDSDSTVRAALAGLLGAQSLERFFNLEEIVRNIVATIDNLPRETYASRLNPVKPIGGLPRTAGTGESLAIAPENAVRYTPFIRLVQAEDAGKVVAVYVHFYPLFQQAYVDLGYPNGYFNDRLIEVIDHLLATPEVDGPLKLVAPHVLYEFADPELEERSAGEKALIRMGSENAAKIKAKLREIRRELTAQTRKP
jgi:hypothetical protein